MHVPRESVTSWIEVIASKNYRSTTNQQQASKQSKGSLHDDSVRRPKRVSYLAFKNTL